MNKPLLACLSIESQEELRLAFADDLHASRLDVIVVSGERQPRFLYSRVGDAIVQVTAAAENCEMQIGELLSQKLLHLDILQRGRQLATPLLHELPEFLGLLEGEEPLNMPIGLHPFGDCGQCAQMGSGAVGRRYHQKKQLHRPTILALELDTLPRQPDRDFHSAQVLHLAVRNGDTAPDGGRAELLALDKAPVHQFGIGDDAGLCHLVSQCAQDTWTIRTGEVRKDELELGERAERRWDIATLAR